MTRNRWPMYITYPISLGVRRLGLYLYSSVRSSMGIPAPYQSSAVAVSASAWFPMAAKIRYVCGGLVLFLVSNLSRIFCLLHGFSGGLCGGDEQGLVVLVDYVDHKLGVLCGGFGIDVVFFAASLCVDFRVPL